MHRIIYLIPYSFFEWCESTLLGHWIAQSKYLFAIFETLHIMALAVLLGSMLVVDMNLLGLGRQWTSPGELTKALGPWTWSSLAVMVSTGVPLLLSEATRMSRSAPFYYKMLFLLLAIAGHITIHRRAVGSRSDESMWLGKLAACVSLICWFGVALAGRAIAFL